MILRPLPAFLTPKRNTSTPRAFFRPRNGMVSKLMTIRAFFRHRNGILRPLARFFTIVWKDWPKKNSFLGLFP